MKRTLCILLAAAMLFVLSACRRPAEQPNADGGQGTPTPAPSAVASPSPSPDIPEVTNTPEVDYNAEFEQLDMEFFTDMVTAGGSSYNQFVADDPAAFGISTEDVEYGWGEISLEAHMESMSYYEEMLDRLHEIDADKLNDMNRIGYHTMEQYLETSLLYRDFYYYDEPLTPMNGLHSMLPLTMICFEIRCKQDAFSYMLLLEDMPNILADIERFEIEKSEQGLFMTETALDQVVESCRLFAEQGDDFFLYAYIDEVISRASEFGLTEDEADELRTRNNTAIRDGILPAYEQLTDTLESLRSTCNELIGASERGGRWLEYYRLSACDEAGYMGDIDHIISMVEEMGTDMYMEMYTSITSDPSVLDRYGEAITFGSTEEDMAWLEAFTEEYYPECPDYALTYVDVPEALSDDFSPAAYIIPPFDNYYDNVILMNSSDDYINALSTLGHEAIPGHMFQFLYFRNMEGLSLTQQLVCPTGYAEAWTVFAEYLIAHNCEELGTGYCTMMFTESTFSNIFLPAYISLMVNVEGWGKDDVMEYMTDYGLGVQEYVDLFYEYAVDMPVYAMSYAFGFAFLLDEYEDAYISTPDEHRQFFETYLSFGPMYFNALEEYLDN